MAPLSVRISVVVVPIVFFAASIESALRWVVFSHQHANLAPTPVQAAALGPAPDLS